MLDQELSRLDLLLDLLADEVAERLKTREEQKKAEQGPGQAVVAEHDAPAQPSITAAVGAGSQAPRPEAWPAAHAAPPHVTPELPQAANPGPASALQEPPAAIAPSRAAVLMARLALGVLIAVVLINIPLNAQGTALARSIPSSAALIIADGLVVKEEASPDIYVYRGGAFHWITSLDAFEHYGYRWDRVHIVEPGFLNDFDKGAPLYVLLKCADSPHIYRLENGQKRWIVDIPTFEAEGYVWEQVRFVPCSYLRALPNGDSIPPGRGTPPPPWP